MGKNEEKVLTNDEKKFFCSFSIYGMENKARIFIEPWQTRGPEYRVIHLGAFREGIDMMVSNYVKIGTNYELQEYL